MNDKIRVLIVEPNIEPYQLKVDNTLKSLQHIVGGYIEVLQLEPTVDIICNEEGKVYHLPLNRVTEFDVIAGTFLIAGHKNEDSISLSRKQIKKYKEVFKLAKHKKYIKCLIQNIRSNKFVNDIEKYGMKRAIIRKLKEG